MAVLAVGVAFAAAAAGAGVAVGVTAATIATLISIGFAVGSTLGSLLFAPDAPDVIGPRLTDLQIQSVSYGTPIPIVYGVVRVPGTVIWGQELETRSSTEEGGGKGKGGGGSSTSYTYWGHIAVAFTAGPIDHYRRVWADGKLIYDARALPATEKYPGEMELYLGTEEQMPNGMMEAAQGLGQVPAYRGLAYIAFGGGHGFPLADFGSHYPTFTAEICREPESA